MHIYDPTVTHTVHPLRTGRYRFGLGSRIIITTRDKSLLTKRRVDAIYKVKELDRDKALMLFLPACL